MNWPKYVEKGVGGLFYCRYIRTFYHPDLDSYKSTLWDSTRFGLGSFGLAWLGRGVTSSSEGPE